MWTWLNLSIWLRVVSCLKYAAEAVLSRWSGGVDVALCNQASKAEQNEELNMWGHWYCTAKTKQCVALYYKDILHLTRRPDSHPIACFLMTSMLCKLTNWKLASWPCVHHAWTTTKSQTGRAWASPNCPRVTGCSKVLKVLQTSQAEASEDVQLLSRFLCVSPCWLTKLTIWTRWRSTTSESLLTSKVCSRLWTLRQWNWQLGSL